MQRWALRSVCVCVVGRTPRMQGSNAPTAASTPQVLEAALHTPSPSLHLKFVMGNSCEDGPSRALVGAERALEGAENEWELRGSAVCACGACVRGARARTEKQGELTDIEVGASKVA